MKFHSTKNKQQKVSLRTALLEGLPADNGLYVPETISPLPETFFQELPEMTLPELSFQISRHLLGEVIPASALKELLEKAMNFSVPVVDIKPGISMLELFHGPTLAFKDFGARFMAGLMGYFVQNSSKTLRILVATSGDTGGAVASGFLGTPGIEVIILYPQGKVSPLQEKQLTALGQNITALEVKGTFDDCQAMVKAAFLDPEVQQHLWLSSANSINIGRLVPQSFYYFAGFRQLKAKGKPIVACVPSGNFGNLTAGLWAQKMGLPIAHFIAATNRNDVIPTYLQSGRFEARPSVPTISNAMDVGNPSNFARMDYLFEGVHEKMADAISGYAYGDQQTRETISRIMKEHTYLLDPHAAVGYLAAENYLTKNPNHQVMVLGTAHPAKFLETVSPLVEQELVPPERLARLADEPKESVLMENQYAPFKDWLLSLDKP
ncbi:MAG: threonine synthase [Bacteroidota bacterium]